MTSREAGERTAAQKRLAGERAAAARARIAAARRRRRLLTVGSSVGVVVLVVMVLVVVKVMTGAGALRSGRPASAAGGSVVARLAAIPGSTFDAVGVGTATAKPVPAAAARLTSAGKPLVLYVGAEYCPYCAAERWAVVAALMRFGSFTGLGQTASSPSDVYPNTATLTFHGAIYRGPYLAFTGKETQSNQIAGNSYAPLDTLTAAQRTLLSRYDGAPYFTSRGGIPFIDIGGRYLLSGASYSPAVLQGKTQAQIAAALTDVRSPIARAADGAANLISAALCSVTGARPAAVCQSPGVRRATVVLGNGG